MQDSITITIDKSYFKLPENNQSNQSNSPGQDKPSSQEDINKILDQFREAMKIVQDLEDLKQSKQDIEEVQEIEDGIDSLEDLLGTKGTTIQNNSIREEGSTKYTVNSKKRNWWDW